jgi:hypothetical protein
MSVIDDLNWEHIPEDEHGRPWPFEGSGYEAGDPGPSIEQIAADVATGRRCVECQCAFRRAQPKTIPNREKTLCRECTRLFVEQRGYNVGPERDAVNEGHARRNRQKRNQK